MTEENTQYQPLASTYTCAHIQEYAQKDLKSINSSISHSHEIGHLNKIIKETSELTYTREEMDSTGIYRLYPTEKKEFSAAK